MEQSRKSTARELAAWMDQLAAKVGSGIQHQVRGRGRGQRIIPVAVKPRIRVERRGRYQGVPQFGITGQSEITPTRATAEKWAALENAVVPKPEVKFVVTLAGHEGRGRRRTPILFYVLSVWENDKGHIAGVRYAPKASEAFLFSKLRAQEIHALCLKQGMRPAVHPVEVTNGTWRFDSVPNTWEKVWAA